MTFTILLNIKLSVNYFFINVDVPRPWAFASTADGQ